MGSDSVRVNSSALMGPAPVEAGVFACGTYWGAGNGVRRRRRAGCDVGSFLLRCFRTGRGVCGSGDAIARWGVGESGAFIWRSLLRLRQRSGCAAGESSVLRNTSCRRRGAAISGRSTLVVAVRVGGDELVRQTVNYSGRPARACRVRCRLIVRSPSTRRAPFRWMGGVERWVNRLVCAGGAPWRRFGWGTRGLCWTRSTGLSWVGA